MTLERSYQPYGVTLSSEGSGASSYGFTREWKDVTGLVFLRARYYDDDVGRFISRDTWAGEESKPMPYNAWAYAYANPILLTDPSGRCPDDDGDGSVTGLSLFGTNVNTRF